MLGRGFEVFEMAGAALDVEDAYKHYIGVSVDLANRFIQAYDKRLMALESFWQYEVVRDGLRLAPVDGFPYYVIYRVVEEEELIRIISVKHERSDSRPFRND
jgi:plasmid stabilization system protein ParE